MTEKRFTYINDRILENGTHFAYANSECNAEDITDKLNELATNCNQLKNENEELKQKVEDLEFALRTELAHQRIEKEKHSDTEYYFKKKLEKW